jgi:riboflavin-specific deaminase-like protein
VLVGVGTALADDPQLNVRLTKGTNPARIVLDPSARLGPTAKVWHEDSTRRLWLVSNTPACPLPSGVELVVLNTPSGHIEPKDILRALHARGLRRVLVEGGAETVSRFMRAGCLDRLHLLVAPIIMGSGRPAFNLPAIQTMDEAVRLRTKAYVLEDEVIYDIDLSSQRLAVDFSKTSENR